MTSRDPSRIQEPSTTTPKEIEFRRDLDLYFANSIGSTVEKLQNFTKYVPRQSIARFLGKHEMFKKVLNVQGSIVECGVYLGGGLMSFAHLSAIFEPVNHQRKIIGFDTFAGFGTLSPEDSTGRSVHSVEGGLSSQSYDDVTQAIHLFDANRALGHIPKVSLIKGDIRETLPGYLQQNPHTVVSLLYLDMDVFEPTKVAIELLLPRMPRGAVLAFDELNAPNWPGETMAVLKTIGINHLRIERFPFESGVSYAVLE